jgi:hypothetical protein
MEDSHEKDEEQRADETVLVAYVTAHLESGESFELLPFEDTQDVKSKVKSLLEDWARSGFLAQCDKFYPWHQVRSIEATKVVELSQREWEQQRQAPIEVARLRTSFWKTKKAREKKSSEEGENLESQQRAA